MYVIDNFSTTYFHEIYVCGVTVFAIVLIVNIIIVLACKHLLDYIKLKVLLLFPHIIAAQEYMERRPCIYAFVDSILQARLHLCLQFHLLQTFYKTLSGWDHVHVPY